MLSIAYLMLIKSVRYLKDSMYIQHLRGFLYDRVLFCKGRHLTRRRAFLHTAPSRYRFIPNPKACAIVNRNFSHKEWEKYIGKDRPHEKTCPDLPKDTVGAIELFNEAHKLLKKGNITEAKAKFAQAREWDNNVVWGDEGL